MPSIADNAISYCAARVRLRRRRSALPAVMIIAGLCGLAACAPLQQGTAPPPANAAAKAPIKTEKLPAPVALAPSLTGDPPPSAPARPAAPPPPAATAVPPPHPPAAAPAPPPAPTPVAAAATVPVRPPPPGVTCPLGTLGMWGEPDVTGTPVYICRQLSPPR